MNTYYAPLRCSDCGAPVHKKPGAKTPKYCPSCRNRRQLAWKADLTVKRRERNRSL